ncbi:MAG: hypothetical protein Q9219_002521 [cf. Caloplaca sp. 3 TL-2023]
MDSSNALGDSSSSTGQTSVTIGTSSRSTGGEGGGSEESARRRRASGSVAAIACSECRRARQKIHKESLLKEIADLQKDNSRLQNLNKEATDLTSNLQEINQGLQVSHHWQSIILDTIGRNGHDREIINRLRAGESSETIAAWLRDQHPIRSHIHQVPNDERGLIQIVKGFEETLRQDDGSRRDKESDTLYIRWTSVSSSQTLLGHLFDLYFTWVHPIHMLFSEPDFRVSYETNNETYCSSALVNAICAMACHLVDPDDTNDEDIETLTNGFMNQARQEVKPQNYMNLCSVQALAVMYLADLSSGRARSAIGYLRASVEFLKAAEMDGQSPEAREISLWGIQTLNTSSTGITYQKLYAPEVSQLPRFQHIDMQSSHAMWRFYRHVGDQRQLPVRPCHAVITACHQATLFRIIHESLNLYCGLRGAATAEAVLTLYRRYKDWEEDLPFIVGAIDEDAQPLPHILCLHIQYHVAALQHLTPPLQSGLFKGSSLQELGRMVIRHAQRGIEILGHMRRLYSSRYLMPLLFFCVIHLGDALIRYSPFEPPASKVVEFCLSVLQEASVGFSLCGPLQELFRGTALELGVELPANIEEITGQLGHHGMDDILDACTRLDYKQPVDQSVRHVASNIAEEWSSKWEEIMNSPNRPKSPNSTRKPAASEQTLRIESLLNG